jgi:hypothetical protein
VGEKILKMKKPLGSRAGKFFWTAFFAHCTIEQIVG